jgi:hypothetical protein
MKNLSTQRTVQRGVTYHEGVLAHGLPKLAAWLPMG